MTDLIDTVRLDVALPMDIVLARGEARRFAMLAGFSMADQTRLATAVSELARNVLQHAGRGFCEVSCQSYERDVVVQIVLQDTGPGIADIPKAMQDGFSTNGGLGAGMSGTRRLVHKFEIESRPGMTRITIAMIKKLGP